ncbi:caspase domain-containing protein [Streptomyces sp. NPDC058676]|uniref:caspase family protein n=1 Tax=unclassified Streptomyces TaxID=2593676 RepID=UPI00365A0B17
MTEARHALIIANDRYDDQGLKQLRAPAQDAAALAEVLHDPEIGDFEVEVIRNEPAHITNRHLQAFFNDRRRDDTLLLHFSCHGLKSESGELYFAAKDTDPRLLDATAVPAHFVRRCMSRTRAGSTVLFLDCCYGGAFSRGSGSVRATGDVNVLESFRGDKPPGGRGRAVITASNSMEYAFEGPELAENSAPRPSVFTHAVVQGLESGEADRDGDGVVTLDELYDYVYDRVREVNPHQTPSKDVEMEGELTLAHSRRGRIKIVKVPSPPSLTAALHSDNAFTRQGAVLELRSRLQNESLPIAEGARQDLEEIARDDIRQIADLACGALREVRLAPSPDRLDFGRVPQGSTPRQQSLTLGGPPLARHCVAQSTQSWLRVEPVANGLTVRLDTSTEGRLSGDIVLKGVADDVVVHVEAVVAPAPGQDVPKRPEDPPRADRDTVIIDTGQTGRPPEQPRRAPQEPVAGRTAPRSPTSPTSPKSRWAPALAGTALALAVTSVITVVLAAVGAAQAVRDRIEEGPGGAIADHVGEFGVVRSLTVCLITAAAALVLGAFARHDLRARHDRYTTSASSWTSSLTSLAKGLAVPALILGALALITYLVGSKHW